MPHPRNALCASRATTPQRLAHLLHDATQGDFVLSADRESIKTGRLWNNFIRDCIPDLLLTEGLDLLKSDPELRTTCLAYIPLPGEVPEESFFGCLPKVSLGTHCCCSGTTLALGQLFFS